MSGIVFLLFDNDLGFIVSGILVKEMAKILKKIERIVLKWGEKNAVTYDITKTKLVLFFRACQQHLNQQLRETTVLIRRKKIKFNKKVIHWLGIWLDN